MNTKIKLLVGVLVVGGVAFFGGMKYGQAQTSVRIARGNSQFTAMLSGVGGGRGGMGFNGTFGQVLAKSATTLTVQLMDGSSRIVFISASTLIAKQASGTLNDVAVGTNIAVTGTSNSDGSVTASQIQIRPAGTPRPSPTPSQ
jgi:hypothetical protein